MLARHRQIQLLSDSVFRLPGGDHTDEDDACYHTNNQQDACYDDTPFLINLETFPFFAEGRLVNISNFKRVKALY